MSSHCRNFRRSILKTQTLLGVALLALSASLMPASYADEKPAAASNAGSRNFYQVLDEVLSDFEFDLKSGQVTGLKDVSIRNVVTSENVPPSFKSHLELLITERILKTTKTRIVHCQACRAKKATMNGDNMVISSPENNIPEMQRIAKMNGISNFMDVAFAYQPGGMILSIEISDVETGTTLWSRTYNSETTRAMSERKGIDLQNEDENTRMEFQPTIQIRPTIYTVMEPKAGSGYSTALGFGVRTTERYDNRTKEVGFELNYYADTGPLTGQPSAKNDPKNIYAGFNLTMLFIHGWNVYGSEENINKARGMVFGGIGGTYASGFLGAVIRGGYEWHLAKHWSVTTFLGYRPQSTLVISDTTTAPVSGVEGGVGVGFIF
jgi:hypothetical protein